MSRVRLKNKKIILGLGITVTLAITGTVLGINGFFGGGASIPSDTMTRGLVGYWNFEEGRATTTYDSSGNNNHGYFATAASSPAWASGKVGTALQFDGVDDYVDAGNGASLNITSAIAIEAWIKTAGAGAAHDVIYSKKSNEGSELDGIRIMLLTDDTLYLQNSVAGVNKGTSVAFASYFNAWTHIVGTYDGSNLRTYINGVLVDTTADTRGISSVSANAIIGRASTAIQYFTGLIDEVRVYNRALSASEVRYHYNRGGPVAQWKFDEGSGLTAYDSSGNGNTGTLQNDMATTSWTSGKSGSALSFDGVDDYVDAGNPAILNFASENFTIEAWIKINTMGANAHTIFMKGTDVTSGYFFYVNADGRFSLSTAQSGAQQTTNSAFGDITAGPWTHVVAVRSGTVAKLYKNGVETSYQAIGSHINPATTTLTAKIGRHGSASANFFNGLIDDVRIYNYARSADEIALDYNAGFAALFGRATSECKDDPGSCMTNGLVGYWGMDEGSGGVAYDASNYANHGTLTSGPAWAKGKVGGGLSFDGADDYVSTGNNSTLNFTSQDFSIEFWLKPSSVTGVHRIIMRGNPNNTGWTVYSNGAAIYLDLTDGTAYSTIANSVLAVGVWNHVFIVRTGVTAKIYVDSIDKTTSSNANNAASYSGNLIIGISDDLSSYPYSGLIDEVRVYNRALTAEEVRYHYNRGGPVAQWKFDEGSGLTAYDSSGNGNTGTLQNNMATTSWVSGKFGSALKFDGLDDYVTTNLAMNGLSSFTYSIWLYPLANTAPTRMIDFAGGRATLDMHYAVANLAFSINTGTTVTVSTSYVPPINTWTFLEATYDGSIMKIYVNGNFLASAAQSGAVDDPGPGSRTTIIGGPVNYSFNGILDDVRIYNYARTADEIALDYNTGFAAKFGGSADCNLNPGACMTKGLVGQWSMDEGNGTTTADISGNGNTGVFATAASSPAWTQGKVGGALSFDGTDDYVSAGNNSSLDVGNKTTFEAWTKTISAVDNGRIISRQDAVGNQTSLLSIESLKARQQWRDSDNNQILLDSTTSINDGKWHHLVGIKDGNNGYLYVDGVLEDSDTVSFTGNFITTNILAIGANNVTFAQPWDGSIDEVRIYNRALSAEEVRYHYNRGGPVALWKFDEGSGLTAYDSSGNGNTGTLQNNMATTSWTTGKYGSALSFDGVDDYVQVADSNSLDITGAITISAWERRNGTGNYQILDKDNSSGGYQMENFYNGRNSFSVRNSTGTQVNCLVDIVDATLPNVWNHVAATFSAGTAKIYTNGVLKKTCSLAITSIGANTANLRVGKRLADTFPFNGLIDDVRIYNYARTQDEILQDYNGGKSIQFK